VAAKRKPVKSKLQQFKEKYCVEEVSDSDNWSVDADWMLVHPTFGGVYPNRNIILGFQENLMLMLNPEILNTDEQLDLIIHIDVADDPSVLDRIVAVRIG
jgi:hypothetical protein